jgi:hypothetical protein
MAAGTLGRVDEFDKRKTTGYNTSNAWSTSSRSSTAPKRAVLLTVVGAAIYKALCNIVSPKKPERRRTRSCCCPENTPYLW